MGDLISKQDILLMDSREVAEMVDKDHAHLCRDIQSYIDAMGQNPKLVCDDFFIESAYQAGTGKNYKCYKITKMGCEMIANKLTGQKGILFTAAYVTKFNEMEQQSNRPLSQLEILAQATQALLQQEQAIKELASQQDKQAEELQGIRDVVTLSTANWRKDVGNLITKMARDLGGMEHIQELRTESYKLLNLRMGVCLETRLTNKRRRMAEEGVCKSTRDKLGRLDVIGEDKKLVEGYVAIIKEMAIKYRKAAS